MGFSQNILQDLAPHLGKSVVAILLNSISQSKLKGLDMQK